MTQDETSAALRLGGKGTRIVAFFPGEGMLVGHLKRINAAGAIWMLYKSEWHDELRQRNVRLEQIRYVGEKP